MAENCKAPDALPQTTPGGFTPLPAALRDFRFMKIINANFPATKFDCLDKVKTYCKTYQVKFIKLFTVLLRPFFWILLSHEQKSGKV